MISSRLLRSQNKYWASTKYEELNRIIETTHQDSDLLAKAEDLASTGAVNNILSAIKIAQSIKENSYVHEKAQELVPLFARKMLNLAKAAMDRRDADTGLAIARRIPSVPELQAEIDDFIVLGEAEKSAWLGTVSGLSAAIAQAQQIDPSREIYEKAQKLIARWQLEIEDVSHLDKARSLAADGTIDHLAAAISEAQLIPHSNPRAQEAHKEISLWHSQIESIEDQPYLDQADQLALADDVTSLQSAIAEASQIQPGRALYPEARKRIDNWTDKIQRIEDQPYLDRAAALADTGDYHSAIDIARNIAASKRALSDQAQTDIDNWRAQISAKENWDRAKNIAATGTPEALVQAISLANKVSTNNILHMDASVAIDQWSQQLLQIARSQGESDINQGIKIAQLIPRGTSAYRDAQDQIHTWQQFLNPQIVQPQTSASPMNSQLSQGAEN